MTADKPAGTYADDLACVHVVELMTDYLEGALRAGDARRLDRHLDTCPGCTEYLQQLRAIAGSLRGLTEEPFPAELREGLVAELRSMRER